MDFVEPRIEELTNTVDGFTSSKKYYANPIELIGFTDEDYPNWDDGSVDTGEYVIVPELKRIYKSAKDDNSSYPPANEDDWLDYGTTMSNRMFAIDEQIGQASDGVDVFMKIDFSRADTIAGLGLYFEDAHIEQKDADGNIVFEADVSGKDIGCASFSDYFYTDATVKEKIVMTGFEWLPESTLEITFTGDVKIQTFVYGLKEALGLTLMGTKLRVESESKFTTNEFTGFKEVIRYGKVRVLDVNVIFDISDFNTLAKVTDRVIDRNVLWIPTELDNFSEMITLGAMDGIEIPIENAVKIVTQTSIVGVITDG